MNEGCSVAKSVPEGTENAILGALGLRAGAMPYCSCWTRSACSLIADYVKIRACKALISKPSL